MQATRHFKHGKSEKYQKLTEIRLRRRDVEMAVRCGEMEYNLDGEEVDDIVENLSNFRYMGRPYTKRMIIGRLCAEKSCAQGRYGGS